MSDHPSSQRDTGSQNLPARTFSGDQSLSPASQGPQYYASFDVHTKEGKKRLLNAINGQRVDSESVLNQRILAVDLVCHPVSRVNEKNGEVTDAIELVILTDDGRAITTWSPWVRKALGMLMSDDMYGKPTWNPPLPLRIIDQKGNSGRTFYTIVPDTEEGWDKPEEQKKGKK